jgi:glycosyltransferase involved in cell wall biosynthesis
VAYDIGGAREVLRDGESGLLLPPPVPYEVCRRNVARLACPAVVESPAAPTAGQASRATSDDAWRPLAAALDRLAADPAAARAMGERWPADVLARFDCRAATAEIMRVYHSVLP